MTLSLTANSARRSWTDCARCFRLDSVAAPAPAKNRTVAASPSRAAKFPSSPDILSIAVCTQHEPATPFAIAYAALATPGATSANAPTTRGATAPSMNRCGTARVTKNAKTSSGYETLRSAESPCGNPLVARANVLRSCAAAWTCATDANATASRNLRRCDASEHARSTNASRTERSW